jgi:hypothetical protein
VKWPERLNQIEGFVLLIRTQPLVDKLGEGRQSRGGIIHRMITKKQLLIC